MSLAIPFTKMQGIGNDFVVVAADDVSDRALSPLARTICDRQTGVGADGLLIVDKSNTADLSMRIFNADGSEDTMCGNGLRCVVAWAAQRGWIGSTGVAETLSGPVPFHIDASGSVTLTLSPPRFWEHSLPDLITVDTGSLHTVRFVDELPQDRVFFSESVRVENDPLFPEKTSLMWTQKTGPSALALRIWERGVGETLGCGTGACAAAVVAIQTGRSPAELPVAVASKGGILSVRWPGRADTPLTLTGPAETVFAGIYQPLTAASDTTINH